MTDEGKRMTGITWQGDGFCQPACTCHWCEFDRFHGEVRERYQLAYEQAARLLMDLEAGSAKDRP